MRKLIFERCFCSQRIRTRVRQRILIQQCRLTTVCNECDSKCAYFFVDVSVCSASEHRSASDEESSDSTPPQYSNSVSPRVETCSSTLYLFAAHQNAGDAGMPSHPCMQPVSFTYANLFSNVISVRNTTERGPISEHESSIAFLPLYATSVIARVQACLLAFVFGSNHHWILCQPFGLALCSLRLNKPVVC